MTGTESAVNSAPSSSSPATFAEAFASETSPASTTPEQTTTPSAAEQPTAAQDITPAAEDDRSPYIPRDRFDSVNAKYNELKTWREQYAWAEQVPREQIEQAVQLAQRYTGDKVQFLQDLIAEAQQDPQTAQQLRSMAARALSQGRGQQAQEAPNYDSLVIDLGNGQSIAMSDLKAQWLGEIRHELQPVVKTVEQVNAERAVLKAQHEAQQFAGSTMQEASQWPGMDDKANRLAVAERIKAYGLTSDDPRDLQIALNRAWRDVVLPQLSSKAQSALLDNLQTKAHASTSVNPGSAAPSTPRNITSFHQLGPEAWK